MNQERVLCPSYRSAHPDVVKPTPVVFMAVNHHHTLVLLQEPLSLQVDLHLLPHGVHPYRGEQPLSQHRNLHWTHLKGREPWRNREWRHTEGRHRQHHVKTLTSLPFLVKKTVEKPASVFSECIPQPTRSPRAHLGPNCCPTGFPLYSLKERGEKHLSAVALCLLSYSHCYK